jgi:glycosyltransferase 2 family protein
LQGWGRLSASATRPTDPAGEASDPGEGGSAGEGGSDRSERAAADGEATVSSDRAETAAPRRRIVLQGLAGLAVSGFFVWLTLRGRDLDAVAAAFAEAEYRRVGLLVGLLLVVHLLRTWRWGLLLAPLGRVGFARLNQASAVGFMALVVLPMRLGELARPYLVSRPGPRQGRSPVTMSGAMGTVIFERLADGIFVSAALVLLLYAVVPADVAVDIRWLTGAAWLLLGIFGSLSVLAWLVHRRAAFAAGLAGRLGAVLGEKRQRWLVGVTDRLIGGLLGPRDAGAWIRFGVLTAVYWSVNAAGILVLAGAFDIALTPLQAATVLGVQLLGAMIPAGPGMLGTFQYFGVLGISLFAAGAEAESAAIAFANVLWAVQFGQQVVLGLIFLPRRERLLSRIAAGEVRAPDAVS